MLKRFLGWLLMLLVGAFLSAILQAQVRGLAGSGAGTGIFEHYFQSRISFYPDPESGDRLMGFMFTAVPQDGLTEGEKRAGAELKFLPLGRVL